MHAPPLRKLNPPLTPNLEEYKQKNKSKSRRKPYSIQPTNPPTPKVHKAQITLKPTSDKLPDKDELTTCPLHPDRPATRYLQPCGNRRFCNKCYLTNKANDECDEEVQLEKRRELDEFKGKIKGFGLRLQQAESALREWSVRSEQNYYKQKQYIQESFLVVREAVDEKERELLNELMGGHSGLKKVMGKSGAEIEEVKKSITRYIEDIDCNYADIIESLSYEQFTEIIEKYNQKLKYYEHAIEETVMDTNLNVYIPRKEIERLIDKAALQLYPELPQPTKTLHRITTEKNYLVDYQYKQSPFHSHHHDSIAHARLAQHRQSRDRYDFAQPLLGKENYNDNLYFN